MLIPIFTGVCIYIYGYFLFQNPSTTYPGSNYITIVTLRIAQACYLMVIIYGLYPIIFSPERFSKKNCENIVTEYEFTKKTLFVGVPILVILIIISRALTYFQLSDDLLRHYFIIYDSFFAILAASIATVIGAILRISVYSARKEFRFYLAIGYCRIASKEKNTLNKISYLFLSIDSYNKFLIRKIKLGIKNINKIYSEILRTDGSNIDEMIKSISENLGGREIDLGVYLSKFYQVPETEQFFAKEALVQKLRTIGIFLATAIPIVISVIQLITGTS